MKPAYLLSLGETPYVEAWELQRSLAAAVQQGAMPDTVIPLEHPPVVTVGRRRGRGASCAREHGGRGRGDGPWWQVHLPRTGPARLLPDTRRIRRRDVKRYVRDLEEAVIRTLLVYTIEGERIEGLTGVWLLLASEKGLLDRRPRIAVGDDARLCAQRRPRSDAVHGLDHGLWPGGRRSRRWRGSLSAPSPWMRFDRLQVEMPETCSTSSRRSPPPRRPWPQPRHEKIGAR